MSQVLEIRALNKMYGGLHATRNVSLEVSAGSIHAVIGPNGAGKTTLISQLFGEVAPSSGKILLLGHDITKAPTHSRARLGMGRSFQITTLARELTVGENVALALLASDGHGFHFWRSLLNDRALRDRMVRALDHVGSKANLDDVVAELSHGEQRIIELALALVARPKILLLDEPMAGLGSEESARMTSLLLQLKGETTIVLVEHDMDAVFALADRISVMVRGELICSGAPDEIRNDPLVRQAYLGEEA